jgi:hypothetical protein
LVQYAKEMTAKPRPGVVGHDRTSGNVVPLKVA